MKNYIYIESEDELCFENLFFLLTWKLSNRFLLICLKSV